MCILKARHNKIIDLLKQSRNLFDIALSLGCCVGTLKKYIQKHNLSVFKRQKTNLSNIAHSADFKIDFLDSSLKISQIAEKYKIQPMQVYYCAKLIQIHRRKKTKILPPHQNDKIYINSHAPQTCQFIFGDGKNAHFCTQTKMNQSPFCEQHTQICYINFKRKKVKNA